MLYDPKNDLSTTAQALLKAADYMEAHGWCQEAYAKFGRVCLIAAIHEVVDMDDFDVLVASRYQLQKYLGCAPIAWNDTVCTSKEEAVAALRSAAWATAKNAG